MYEGTCEKNPVKKDSARKYSVVMQVGGGVNNDLNHIESTSGSVF